MAIKHPSSEECILQLAVIAGSHPGTRVPRLLTMHMRYQRMVDRMLFPELNGVRYLLRILNNVTFPPEDPCAHFDRHHAAVEGILSISEAITDGEPQIDTESLHRLINLLGSASAQKQQLAAMGLRLLAGRAENSPEDPTAGWLDASA